MPLLTALLRAAIGLMVGLAALAWIRRTFALGRVRALVAALLMGYAVFLSLAGLELLPAAPVQLRITGVPQGHSVTGTAAALAGTVSAPDARVTLWVHPVASNRWWVQPPARVSTRGAAGDARWTATVFLGDSARGGGEGFEVVAVGSRAPLAWDVLTGRSYRTGEQVRRLPPLSQSRAVLLRRER